MRSFSGLSSKTPSVDKNHILWVTSTESLWTCGPSPTPNLLGTNNIPSETEVSVIRKTLSELQYPLELIDKEIFRLQSSINELQRRRQTLTQYRKDHRDILSPVRRMPVELLEHIFTWCLPEQWQNNSFTSRSTQLLLSQICRRWRHIALRTRGLWSNFNFPSQKTFQIEITEIWLTRSGNAPINFSIASGFVDSRPGMRVVEQILQMLVDHSRRWKHVEISLRPTMMKIMSKSKACIPLLRSLAIDCRGDFSSEALDAFEIAPQLKTVRFIGNEGINPTRFSIPWLQLHKCVVDRSNYGHALDIMRRAENMDTIYFDSAQYGIAVPPGIIYHARLKFLSIRYHDDTALKYLFRHISSPALQGLTLIRVRDDSAPSPWTNDFVKFLSRSSCSLKKMIFYNIHLADGQLTHCLEHLPQLEELEIGMTVSGGDTDDIAKQLHVDISDHTVPPLGPALQAIIFDVHYHTDRKLLMDMIQSRWHTPSHWPSFTRLQRVILINRYTSDQLSLEPRCRRFRDEGLDITVRNC